MSYPSDPRWQQPPQYPPQAYPPQYQQQPQAPRVTVTKKPITFVEHVFHFFMTCCTCGLWIPVWIARAAGKRKERTRNYY